jgi:hypothetical protein
MSFVYWYLEGLCRVLVPALWFLEAEPIESYEFSLSLPE